MDNNVIILGGGGGASSLLKALKNLVIQKKISTLTSIVSNADDGGSTGYLRNQYNTSAWGDITKNILALADKEDNDFAQSLNCRFNTGFLKGHTLRNILAFGISQLTSCDDQCAIDSLCKILKINSNFSIVPITSEPSILRIRGFSQKKSNNINKNSENIILGQKKISTELPLQKNEQILRLYN